MTVTNPLEHRLRDAFARSAAEAPMRPPAAGEPPLFVVSTIEETARRRRLGRPALIIGAAAATLALLVALRDVRHDATPAFQPEGTEVPLSEVTPPDPGAPVQPGSLVGLQVPGHPTISKYVTLSWQDGHVVEHRCTSSDGGAGCSPAWNWASPDLSWTSTVDNSAGAFNLYTWANVPNGTAFVSWNSPTGPVWQRPVAGFVGLPYTGETVDDRLVAYDAAGNVIDEVDTDIYFERLRASTPPGGWQTDPANPEFLAYATTDNLSSAQRGELSDLATETVGACLAEEGATWDGCVAEAEAVVDARFAAMGGEIVPYEPPTLTGEPVELPVTITTAPG